jgi:sigma-E factor negative regulatory protein RseA
MVMGEEISLLVDGELAEHEVTRVCGKLRDEQALETWVAYHVIGDCLRQGGEVSPGFYDSFRARLAAEPTVLAPVRRTHKPAFVAWAVAASVAAVAVVGWFGIQQLNPTQTPSVAVMRPAEGIAPVAAKPQAGINEYLMVHQAYSPTTALQGVRPYIRTVAESGQEAR